MPPINPTNVCAPSNPLTSSSPNDTNFGEGVQVTPGGGRFAALGLYEVTYRGETRYLTRDELDQLRNSCVAPQADENAHTAGGPTQFSGDGTQTSATPAYTDRQIHDGMKAYYEGTRQSQLDAAQAAKTKFAEEVRHMTPKQIEQQWSAHRDDFVAIASKPGHGLKADQVYWIWLKHWSDRHDVGTSMVDRTHKDEAARDRGAFERKMVGYYEDNNRDAFGPAYHQAESDVSNAKFMFRHSVDAMEVLRAVDNAGKEFTLSRLDEVVIGVAGLMDPLATMAEQIVTLRPGPVRPEIAKPKAPETKPSQPAKTTTDTTDPAYWKNTPSESRNPMAGREVGTREVTDVNAARAKRGTTTGPEPKGPPPAASKVANDNAATAANDNQQAVPRKMAVGDPHPAPTGQPITAGTGNGRRGNGYDDDSPRRTQAPSTTKVTGVHKVDLKNSAELKRLLPSAQDRTEFMSWLKQNHVAGDLGEEIPVNQKPPKGHDHVNPGTRLLEQRVDEWKAETGKGPRSTD